MEAAFDVPWPALTIFGLQLISFTRDSAVSGLETLHAVQSNAIVEAFQVVIEVGLLSGLGR